MSTQRKLFWIALLYFAEGMPMGIVVDTDFAAYRRLLPDGQFFKEAEPLFPALYPKVEPSSRSASPTRPVP